MTARESSTCRGWVVFVRWWHEPNLLLRSGTGAAGISAAKLFSVKSVCLTDLPCLVPLITENVEKNRIKDASVIPFVWGETVLPVKERPFDVIILNDVVTKAYSAGYESLVSSLWDLSHDETKILLTVELRAAEDKDFLRLLSARGFEWSTIDDSLLDPNWSSDDIRTFVVTKTYGANDTLYK